jgi:hypothetical protein
MPVTFHGIALEKEPTFDKEAVFRNFGEQFKLDDKVIQHLLSLGMESLDDFYHYVSSTAEIEDKVISRVADITDIAGLQTARLRKAWKTLGDALSQASKAAALGQTGEDLDVPLGRNDADRLKERFWGRYHMRFPIHVEPDERFVQRIHKELLIRCLSLHDPMKVKAAAIKPKALRSERLTDKLALTEIHDVKESRPETVSGYLSGLRTLMIALARAGCIPIDNQFPESFNTATLLYVECPLDITLAYYFKCEKAVLSNNGDRLQWLRTRDEDDSSEWFYRLQKTLTIGNIIATVAVECAAIWQAENPSRAQASQCQDVALSRLTSRHQKRPKIVSSQHKSSPQKSSDQPHEHTDSMSYGASICQNWNRKQCKDPCPGRRLDCATFSSRAVRAACVTTVLLITSPAVAAEYIQYTF